MDKAHALREQLALVLSSATQAGHTDSPLFRKWKSIIDLYDMLSGEEPRIIGVYGTPKMGKSTLLNSIVQEDILPRGITPVTGAVIDLKRDCSKKEYTVRTYRGDAVDNYHSHESVEKINIYLKGIAGQNNPAEKVEVIGPFPHAPAFFGDQCWLRDTPGAISKKAVAEQLEQDSKRAIQSMDEVRIPLFCVSCESLQAESHVEFYRDFFKDRMCVHVITQCDAVDGDGEDCRAELRNAFSEAFGVYEEVPMAFTAKADINSPFVTEESVNQVVEQFNKLLDKDYIANLLEKSCRNILEQCKTEKNGEGTWNPKGLGWNIHVVTLMSMNDILSN